MTNPVTVQSDFRVRNDDGSQTTATWVAAQNTNCGLITDKNYRLRFNIRETNSRNFTLDAQLEYNLAGAGFIAVNASSSVVRSSDSPNFTDGDATTEQLAGAGTFTAGKMEDVDGLAAAVTINNQDTEIEWCFQIRSADVTSGQLITFRCTDAGVALTTYTVTPSITVSEPGAGLSSGVATAIASSKSSQGAAGSSSGLATPIATGRTTNPAAFLSSGIATAVAVGSSTGGATTVSADGYSAGIATPVAVGTSIVPALTNVAASMAGGVDVTVTATSNVDLSAGVYGLEFGDGNTGAYTEFVNVPGAVAGTQTITIGEVDGVIAGDDLSYRPYLNFDPLDPPSSRVYGAAGVLDLGLGSANGIASAVAVGTKTQQAAGAASGVASAIATGAATSKVDGYSAGLSAPIAVGSFNEQRAGAGYSAGTSVSVALGASNVSGDGYTAGLASANAEGSSQVAILSYADGYASGLSLPRAVGSSSGGTTVDKSGILPRRKRMEDIIQEEDEEIMALLAQALPQIIAAQLEKRT